MASRARVAALLAGVLGSGLLFASTWPLDAMVPRGQLISASAFSSQDSMSMSRYSAPPAPARRRLRPSPLSTPSRLDGSWGPRVESGHNRDHSCLEGPMKTLPLAHVKANLSRIVDQVVETDEEIVITRNGRPAAILVSPDEYEGWKETQAIRSDRELVAEIRRGLRTLKRGAKIYTLEELLPEE
jgi:antitoxin YefM